MSERTVLVVDDHPLCAAAVSCALERLQPSCSVETVRAVGGLEAMVGRYDLSLILLDLKLPDVLGFSGLEAARRLFPHVPICLLSGQDDANTVRQSIARGAVGFISKALSFEELSQALKRLLDGDCVIPKGEGGGGSDGGHALSPAEQRIMQLLCLGLQNKQIAHELGLSESTVKSHLAHIYVKLRVTNRAQAILTFKRMTPDGQPLSSPPY